MSSTPPSAHIATPERIQLAAQHLELVRTLAAKLYRLRWGDSIPFEDYYQSGVVGMLEAVQRFEPALNVKFSTFAAPRITGSILNHLVHATEIHEQNHARRRLLAQRVAAISESLPASEDKVELSLMRIAEAAIGLAIGFMLEGSGMYREGHETESRDAYLGSALRQTHDRLRKSMILLTSREREVVEKHYYRHMSFDEIARDLSLTKGRISQIHSSAIARLRNSFSDNAFQDFEA